METVLNTDLLKVSKKKPGVYRGKGWNKHNQWTKIGSITFITVYSSLAHTKTDSAFTQDFYITYELSQRATNSQSPYIATFTLRIQKNIIE